MTSMLERRYKINIRRYSCRGAVGAESAIVHELLIENNGKSRNIGARMLRLLLSMLREK